MKKVLPSLDMNSAKLVVQVKVVKNARKIRGSHLTRSKGCTPTFDAKAIPDRYFISHVFYL